jgi:hypothetical protein
VQQIKGLDIPKLANNLVQRRVSFSAAENVMAEYVYICAGINASLPPVFRIASVEVVS